MPNHNCQGEVAQTLASATSKWGLDKEVPAASSVLWRRAEPECPEDNLRELMWDSEPKLWDRQRRKKRIENFPAKGSNLQHDPLTEQRIEQNTKGKLAD